MNTRYLSTVALVILLQAPEALHASGERVVMFLRDRTVVIGELLSVRDTGFVLATKMGYSDAELESIEGSRIVVSTGQILEIKVKGKSHVMTGALVGASIGLAAGVAITLTRPRDEGFMAGYVNFGKDLGIIVGSTACGLFLGGVWGEAESRADMIVLPERSEVLASLKKFARFPTEEPEFLQKVNNK